MRREKPDPSSPANSHNTSDHHAADSCDPTAAVGTDATHSQQVSWWSVHEYVQPVLGAAGCWPLVGTPAWCALDDDDPVKLASVYDAAQHHALRVDTAQTALAEASRDVAAAADWSAIAKSKFRHDCAIAHGAYIPRVVT